MSNLISGGQRGDRIAELERELQREVSRELAELKAERELPPDAAAVRAKRPRVASRIEGKNYGKRSSICSLFERHAGRT